MIRKNIINHWSQYVLVSIAIVSTLSELNIISPDVMFPLLLGAIVVSSLRNEGIVERIQTKLSDNSDEVKTFGDYIKKIAKSNCLVEVEEFSTRDDFYNSLVASLNKTKNSVKLTAIRKEPPNMISTTGNQADNWYEGVIRWVKEREGERDVKRIVATSDPNMLKWAREEDKKLKKKNVGNFEIFGIDWDFSSGLPAINVCIFDDKDVYLIFTPMDKKIKDNKFLKIESISAANLFNEYFLSLELKAKKIADILDEKEMKE